MRTYFGLAGRESTIRMEALKGEYVLESFYYPLDRRWRAHYKGVFLDSGAFSAWRKGEQIDLQEYAEYALAGTYDAIAGDLRIEGADPDQTVKDTEYLRGLGLPALPAFHQGEPFEFLEYLVANYDHIGIGCTEATSTSASVGKWLYECFERICDVEGWAKVKVHGYRFTSQMGKFPFYSVDSSSWAQSSANSFSSIQQAYPFLTPLEVGHIVKRYYATKPRATRLRKQEAFTLEMAI